MIDLKNGEEKFI